MNAPATQPRLLRVLIVDDTPQVRQDLRQLLQLRGRVAVVGEAAEGGQAIALAQALHPDVVVMDLEMPGMDGWEATRRIKAGGLADRVVILSIHAEAGEVHRAFQLGADAFIQKGDCYEALIAAIAADRRNFQFPKEEL